MRLDLVKLKDGTVAKGANGFDPAAVEVAGFAIFRPQDAMERAGDILECFRLLKKAGNPAKPRMIVSATAAFPLKDPSKLAPIETSIHWETWRRAVMEWDLEGAKAAGDRLDLAVAELGLPMDTRMAWKEMRDALEEVLQVARLQGLCRP